MAAPAGGQSADGASIIAGGDVPQVFEVID